VAVARVATKGYDLEFIPPVDDGPSVEMTDDDLQAADPKLQECLVGFYLGKRIPFKVTEAAFKKVWGPNLVELMADGKGFFYFHIPDWEFRRKVLEGGLITVSKVPLVLQQWRPALDLRKDSHLTVPVWVRLKNLPPVFWSSQAISKIASKVGKPLYVDRNTDQMKALAYARVCVEITAKQPSCESIELVHQGNSCFVEVEYEWRPTACVGCGVFGHKCSAGVAQISTANAQRSLIARPHAPQDGTSSPNPSSRPAVQASSHPQFAQSSDKTHDNPLFIKKPDAGPIPAEETLTGMHKVTNPTADKSPSSLNSTAMASGCEGAQELPLPTVSAAIPHTSTDPGWKQVKKK